VIGLIEIDSAASPGLFRELRPVIRSSAPAGRFAKFSGVYSAEQSGPNTEFVAADVGQLRAELQAQFMAFKARIR
jgi:hypothetical protein